MVFPLSIKVALATLGMFMLTGGSSSARTYTFSSEEQFSDEFVRSGQDVFAYSATGGMGGTGGVVTKSGTASSARSYLTTNETFTADTNITLSVNFQWSTANLATGDVIVIGFGAAGAGDTSFQPYAGNNGTSSGTNADELHLGLSVTGVANQIRFTGSALVSGTLENFISNSLTYQTLTAGQWYLLEANFVLNDDQTGFHLNVGLFEANADGSKGDTIYVWTAPSKINPNLVGSTAHAYMMSRLGYYSGVSAIDNFYVSTLPDPIPEPSMASAVVLGLGALTWFARRRKA